MRASTLFALTAAVLIGLGIAVSLKMSGYFTARQVDPVRATESQVLVAARNVFKDDMIDQTAIRVRNLKPSEVAAFNKDRDQYLPASLPCL